MTEQPAAVPGVANYSHPRLSRGCAARHNEAHGGWVSAWRRRRVFKANAISAEILKRCNGDAAVPRLVDDLAKTIQHTAQERIHADVVKLLASASPTTKLWSF